MPNKRSQTLKQTSNFQLQVCLSMYDHLVDNRRARVNNTQANMVSVSTSMLTSKADEKLPFYKSLAVDFSNFQKIDT